MVVLLLAWVLLAFLGAWIIGAGIRLAELRRPRIASDAGVESACQQSDEAVEQLAAAG